MPSNSSKRRVGRSVSSRRPDQLPRGRHNLPISQVIDDQRRRIVAAVPPAMAQYGYAETSVQNVIEAAGVSRRSFYLLFDDKDDVFRAAYESTFERLHAEVMRACRAQAQWPEQVRAAIATALRFAAADPPAARLIVIESLAAGEQARARHHSSLQRLAAELRHGRERNPGPAPLPPLTEQALIASLAAVIAERLDAGEAARLPELIPQLVELTLAPYLGAQEAHLVAHSQGWKATGNRIPCGSDE